MVGTDFGYQATIHHLALMAAMDEGLLPVGSNLCPPFFSALTEIPAMKNPVPRSHLPVSPGIPVRCNPNAIYVCSEPLIGFVHQGLKAKIVAGVNMCGSSLVTKKPYNEPGDLEGLLIGVNYGSFQETFISKFIQDNQIEKTKLVDISNFPERADAAFMAEPYATQAIPPKGHITTSEMMLRRPHACCGLAVSGDLIENHRETVKQIVEAQKKATDIIQMNSVEQNEKIFRKHTKISWAGPALKNWKPSWWISDPSLLIEDTMDYAEFLGIPIAQDDLFDTSFY